MQEILAREYQELVGIEYFIDNFKTILEDYNLLTELHDFYDDNGLFKEKKWLDFVNEVKANNFSENNKEILGEIESLIADDGEDGEGEVLEAGNGITIFLLSARGPITWLDYEGDGYRYFKSRNEAISFVKNWY
jgi:hypothetical protein